MLALPVISSNIKQVGYNEETCEFQIEFLSGGIYLYKEIPKSLFEGFINATESHGTYYNDYIKGRKPSFGPYRWWI